MNKYLKLFFLPILLTLLANSAVAQDFERHEPDVRADATPKSPYSEGLLNGMSFNLELNDFGIAIGGQYRRAVSFNNEIVLDFGFTALKDEREQTLQTIFGQQIIPNKYSRVLSIPVMLGFKKRLFSEQLSDNFRIYTQASLGAAFAFVYPYFDDSEGLGFIRNNQIPYDVFQGWGEGSIETGMSGLLGIGVDFGNEFRRFQSVRFSNIFYYFPDGIQIMEPNNPNPDFDGFEPNYYLGSPSITLKFGGMW